MLQDSEEDDEEEEEEEDEAGVSGRYGTYDSRRSLSDSVQPFIHFCLDILPAHAHRT